MENKTIRIGSGAGYGGDRIEPAIDLLAKADCDYIIFECLAERTIALANQEKKINPNKGYNPLSLYRFEMILDQYKLKPFKTKIITNMGAANSIALAQEVKQMINDRGLNLKVAAIMGDDIFDKLDLSLNTIETNEPLSLYKNQLISANAYIGINGIVEALKQGADIIIGGRIADPSLALAPLVYEFNWKMDDYDYLARGTCAGHLLECAAQVCGGYFFDGVNKEVPNLENLGFPYADISSTGDIIISKLESSGGVVNEMTVKEQLLYEIMDPSNYFTPDVIMDISHASVIQIGINKVQISNVYGKAPNGFYKVSCGITDGYMVEAEISYGGHHCTVRAQKAIDILSYRLCDITPPIQFDLIGLNSLYKTPIERTQLNEVRVRVACKTNSYEEAQRIANEVESLYTNGPAGGGGVRRIIQPIVSILSVLVNREILNEKVVLL